MDSEIKLIMPRLRVSVIPLTNQDPVSKGPVKIYRDTKPWPDYLL